MENKNYWENPELEYNSQNNLFVSLVNYVKNHENIENVDCSRLNFSKKEIEQYIYSVRNENPYMMKLFKNGIDNEMVDEINNELRNSCHRNLKPGKIFSTENLLSLKNKTYNKKIENSSKNFEKDRPTAEEKFKKEFGNEEQELRENELEKQINGKNEKETQIKDKKEITEEKKQQKQKTSEKKETSSSKTEKTENKSSKDKGKVKDLKEKKEVLKEEAKKENKNSKEAENSEKTKNVNKISEKQDKSNEKEKPKNSGTLKDKKVNMKTVSDKKDVETKMNEKKSDSKEKSTLKKNNPKDVKNEEKKEKKSENEKTEKDVSKLKKNDIEISEKKSVKDNISDKKNISSNENSKNTNLSKENFDSKKDIKGNKSENLKNLNGIFNINKLNENTENSKNKNISLKNLFNHSENKTPENKSLKENVKSNQFEIDNNKSKKEIKKESDFFKENIVAQNIFGQKNQETSENKPSFINSDFSKENPKNNYLNDENKRSDFFKSNLDNENTSFKNLHNDNKNMSTFFVENPKTDPEVRKAEQIETIKREEKEKKEKDKPTALEEENIRINTKRMNNAKIIPNVTGNAVMYTGLAAISRAETINSLVSNGSKGVSDIKAAINNFKNAENKSKVIEFEDGKGGKGKIELDTLQTAETKKTGEGIFGEVKKASHVKFLNRTETKQIKNNVSELRTSTNENVIFKSKNIQSSEDKGVKVTETTIDKTR